MAEAAQSLAALSHAPDIIDINMGCPVKKIVSNGEGCALMKNPDLAQRIVRAVRDAVSLPVTVKFRTGFTESQKNATFFAQAMEAAGADAICIHGRTREQMYQPPIDIETIAQVKKSVSVPVFANGGIYTVEDAKTMIERTDCDGLAIAQGSYGNPFLFSQIRDFLDGKEIVPVTLSQKLQTARAHLSLLLEEKGEHTGVLEARRHISWYFNHIKGAAAFRRAFFSAQSPQDFYCIFDEIESNIEE
jgi:tRNA-dihydrouridine synthase B